MAEEKDFLDYKGLEHYHHKISQKIEDGDSLSSALAVNLGVNGKLGGYKTGDIIAEDTLLKDIIEKLLSEASYSESIALDWGELGAKKGE